MESLSPAILANSTAGCFKEFCGRKKRDRVLLLFTVNFC